MFFSRIASLTNMTPMAQFFVNFVHVSFELGTVVKFFVTKFAFRHGSICCLLPSYFHGFDDLPVFVNFSWITLGPIVIRMQSLEMCPDT